MIRAGTLSHCEEFAPADDEASLKTKVKRQSALTLQGVGFGGRRGMNGPSLGALMSELLLCWAVRRERSHCRITVLQGRRRTKHLSGTPARTAPGPGNVGAWGNREVQPIWRSPSGPIWRSPTGPCFVWRLLPKATSLGIWIALWKSLCHDLTAGPLADQSLTGRRDTVLLSSTGLVRRTGSSDRRAAGPRPSAGRGPRRPHRRV